MTQNTRLLPERFIAKNTTYCVFSLLHTLVLGLISLGSPVRFRPQPPLSSRLRARLRVNTFSGIAGIILRIRFNTGKFCQNGARCKSTTPKPISLTTKCRRIWRAGKLRRMLRGRKRPSASRRRATIPGRAGWCDLPQHPIVFIKELAHA